MRAEEVVLEAAASVKSQVLNDWSVTLERISAESGTIREGVQIMEMLRDEVREMAITAAKDTQTEIVAKCENVLSSCAELKVLKTEISTLGEEIKQDIRKVFYEVSEKMNTAVEGEIEMIRDLRLKLEESYEILNTKINNRLEMIGAV